MKIEINLQLCEGNAKCVAAAPEVFQLDEASDKAVVTVDDVSPELKSRVDLAIRTCPRQAITWAHEKS
jgi:ferredoxin